MLSAAGEKPNSRQRMFWPSRDAALLRFLATTGARAEEACGVTIGELDRRAERPIWRVGRAKGGKTRDVPLPRTTIDVIDDWLAERVRPGEERRALKARRADPLFVRPDGTSLSPQALDRVVRGLAHRAGVVVDYSGVSVHPQGRQVSRVVRRRWLSSLDGMSRRDRQGCEYEAYVPDGLAKRHLRLDGDVAADVADAEAAILRLNASAVALADTEALARPSLRAESVASSYIEGLVIEGLRLLRAEAARAMGDAPGDITAEEVLGNIRRHDLGGRHHVGGCRDHGRRTLTAGPDAPSSV